MPGDPQFAPRHTLLRLWLLAHAAVPSLREYRFPRLDEAIETFSMDQRDHVRMAVGACDLVWSAPERRSLTTAAALDLAPTHAVDALSAWSVGDWTGRSLESLIRDDADAFQSWQADPAFAPPHGESLSALLARTAAWAESLAADRHARQGLVVADPAVIRALVVHVLAAGPATFWRFDVPPLGLSLVQYAGGQWRLRQLGVFRSPSGREWR